MKLSIIVPMYNVEAYIEECLDSLVNQTLKDFEVLLVDDGCIDSTVSLVKPYLANYSNFHLLQKENGGLSDARNYAIPYAKGTYICFLDSDDFVEPTLYEKLVNLMDEGDYDVCVTDIEFYYKDANKRFVMKGLSDWKASTIQKQALLSPMFAWNKIYKRSLFEDDYRYPVNTWYEDIPVTTMIFARATKIGYLQECLMHYRQREGSIMQDNQNPRVKEIFQVMEMVRENFENAGLYETYYDELEYLHIEHLRLYGMFRFIRSSSYAECYEMAKRVMFTCFPNWKKNIYLKNLSAKNYWFLKLYGSGSAWLFNKVIR